MALSGWAKIDELVREYSGLVTAPDRCEIFYHRGRITQEKITIDLRTSEQIVLANQIIEGMVPYLKRQARLILNSHVRIGKRKISFHSAKGKFSLEELAGVGAVGIMKGLGKFDQHHGAKFTTYITSWINRELAQCLTEEAGMIYLPKEIYFSAAKVMREKHQQAMINGRKTEAPADSSYHKKRLAELVQPKFNDDRTSSEMAQAIYFALKGNYIDIHGLASKHTLSEDPAGSGIGRGTKYEEILPDDEEHTNEEFLFSAQEQKQLVNAVLAALPLREQTILMERFYENKILEEIGREQGVSKQRIHTLEVRALRKLKKVLENDYRRYGANYV